MIITFATQKGGTGKTTLAIAFANYISTVSTRNVLVYDYDFQRSFYKKWLEDESSVETKLYDVIDLNENKSSISDLTQIVDLKNSDTINIFDLAGTLDRKYADILQNSDFIIIPFEYSDVSAESTLVFINVLGEILSTATRIFIRSRHEQSYKYPNRDLLDSELERFGLIAEIPIYRRSSLQKITTRKLTANQKEAVKQTFDEIILHINETAEITI